MKRFIAVLVLVFSGAGAACAAGDAQQLVQETTDRIISRIKAEQDQLKNNPEMVYGYVEEIVLPHFDFAAMSAWVVGKYWRQATADQRERFTREFRLLLVRTYARALIDNVDRKINFAPMREATGTKEVTVRTEVQQEGPFPIPIDYKMHQVDGAWKVFDVSIDNISLVANYRTSFAKDIRQDGLDTLIAKLVERNQRGGDEQPAAN